MINVSVFDAMSSSRRQHFHTNESYYETGALSAATQNTRTDERIPSPAQAVWRAILGVRSGRLDCDRHAERSKRSNEPEGDRRRSRSGSDDSGSDQCFEQLAGVTDEFHDDLDAAGVVPD